MTIDPLTHCSSCGADLNKNTLEENLDLIGNCTNCIADLNLKGGWTGVANHIMTQLVEKHGIKLVTYTYEKLRFMKL